MLVTHPSHSNPLSAPRVFLSFKGKDRLLFFSHTVGLGLGRIIMWWMGCAVNTSGNPEMASGLSPQVVLVTESTLVVMEGM